MDKSSAAHTGFGDCGCDVCCPEPSAASPSLRKGLLDGSVCPDCDEATDECQAKANVKGACWRWNESHEIASSGTCTTCGREMTTVEAIRSDCCPSCDPDTPSAAQGRLHGKYHGLRRTSDNSEVEGWYFVIREGDEAGKAALLAYADACEDYAPELAADLRQRVRDERLMDGLYETGWER